MPSDPNADFDRSNSYHASIGSTTYESPITTPGMFAVWTCYGIRDCTDGSSNTIAFAEALTGQDNAGFGYGTQITAGRHRPYRGTWSPRPNPGTGGQGSDDPQGYYGTSAQFLFASANSAAVLAGLQACAGVELSRRGVLVDARFSLVRRQRRLDIYQHHPDAQQGHDLPRRWVPVRLFQALGIDSSFSYAVSSNHPGGANILMADGSVRFIKDSVSRLTWWALGTRNGGEVISSDSY